MKSNEKKTGIKKGLNVNFYDLRLDLVFTMPYPCRGPKLPDFSNLKIAVVLMLPRMQFLSNKISNIRENEEKKLI